MGRHLRYAILLAAALAPAILSAQTAKTWTSATGDFADFATGTNWSGGTAPANSTATNYAQFTNASYYNNQAALAASRSISGVEWTSTSGGGALSYSNGAVLTLGTYGLRTSALGTVDIDVPLALGASTSFLDNGSTFWISSSVALGANTLTLGGNSTYGYSRLMGLLSGTGGLTVNHTGTYGWILGNNNTYTGTTTLTAGTVMTGTGGLGTGTVVFNGGTLAVNTSSTFNNALTIANTAIIDPATYTATFNGAATLTGSRTITVASTGAVVFNGAVGQSSAGYALTKSGGGALVLNAASTYTGTTTIAGGSLALGTSGTISGANLMLNGGTLATSGTWSRALGTGAGQFQFGSGGGGFAAYGGPLTVTIAGASPTWYTLFGGQYARFGSTVADNVVTFTNDLDLISTTDHYFLVDDNTATTADYVRYTGVLSGSGYFNKQGDGKLVLAGANTNTGSFRVLGGTLRAENASAFGTGAVTLQSSTLELGTDTALDLANNFNTTSGSVTLVSDRLTPGEGLMHQLGNLSSSSTTFVKKGANVTSGTAGLAFDAVTDGSFNVDAGVKLELGSYSSTVNATFTGNGDIEVLGAFNTGTRTLTKNGTGTLTLNTGSARTGPTSLVNGTVRLNASGALGTGTINLLGSATIAGSGNLTFTNTLTNQNPNTLTIANSAATTTFSGPVNLTINTNQILTLNNDGTVVISGVIANGSAFTGTLTKTGAGVLTLSGANTFTGNLTANAGTLNLTGSLANSLTTIANGATLTGGGSLHNLSLAGIYSPGNSAALVSLDSLAMTSTAILNFEIGGTARGTEYDALAIAGAFAGNGTLNVSFINGFTPAAAATFNLFDFSSASGSFTTMNLPTLGAGYSWDTSQLFATGELTLNFTPVPEPSTYALLAGGLGLLVWQRRRKARR